MAVKTSQCERILRHLADFGSITSAEAVTEYGIYRLASRISDLKKRGYSFETEFQSGKNRYGEPTSFKVYRLAGASSTANAVPLLAAARSLLGSDSRLGCHSIPQSRFATQ